MNTPQGNSSASFPPGWYQDPWNPTGFRWWDGIQWTVKVNARPSQFTVNQAAQPAWQQQQQRPLQPARPYPPNAWQVNQQAPYMWPHEVDGESHSQSAIDDLPALKDWKTSWGFSILGFFTSVFANAMFTELLYRDWSLGPMVYLFALVFTFVYALVFYRSYFTKAPIIKSSRAICFLNFFVTGPIFGWFLNRNLDKSHTLKRPETGISYIVYVVLNAILITAEIFGFPVEYRGSSDYIYAHQSSQIIEVSIADQARASCEVAEGGLL